MTQPLMFSPVDPDQKPVAIKDLDGLSIEIRGWLYTCRKIHNLNVHHTADLQVH